MSKHEELTRLVIMLAGALDEIIPESSNLGRKIAREALAEYDQAMREILLAEGAPRELD